MGTVYRAYDTVLERQVALKLPQLSAIHWYLFLLRLAASRSPGKSRVIGEVVLLCRDCRNRRLSNRSMS